MVASPVQAHARRRKTLISTALLLAITIALLQGIGGALEKKGVGEVTGKLGTDELSLRMIREDFWGVARAALTTPLFMVGLLMVTVLGGGLFMIALSMGDGAKTGLFVASLASGVYLLSNVLINGERLQGYHVAGMGLGMVGSVLIALGGLKTAA